MIKIFDLEKMEKRIFRFLMVLFVFVMFNTISVGYSLVSSYIENHPKMEYVSQTNEKFYHKMVKMERNTTEYFNGFPICLIDVRNSSPGDAVLTTEKDTLYLAFEGLNYKDINRYPFYVIRDNKNNFWSLSRRNDRFHLTKRDKKDYEDLPKIKGSKDNKPNEP
jgi:hypothetical protein